ncbi:MAG TPA: hypothetical protein PKC19_08000 [Roseiflexaceae bacterium]|nr:hypothetical protein [Roseiflexaceae bacterium]
MRFPASDRLHLPCRFSEYIPGRQHPDGRRYLPLLLFELDAALWLGGTAPLLSVIDRHHRVDPADVGSFGAARLVFLLSSIRLQPPPPLQGLLAEPACAGGRPSSMPQAYGLVQSVDAWEVEQQHLSYQQLYTELVLAIGQATVGVRTSATAADLAAQIGTNRITPMDPLCVMRSRIDILGFTREAT